MTLSNHRANVAYIAGSGRSGSTLLALILGEIPGFVAVGELSYVWDRGILHNELCGCGVPFRSCSFWEQVGIEAFGGWESVDLDEVLSLRHAVARVRHWPLLLVPQLRPKFFKNVIAYAQYLERVYTAVHRVSHASVIIDSSKGPHRAFLLQHMREVDPRIVHIVRDSRGVAFSWTRRVRRSEGTGSAEYMDTYGPFKSAFDWMAFNLPFHLTRVTGMPRLLVTYESLIASPRNEVLHIARLLQSDASESDLAFLDSESAQLTPHHTVSGNPVRFQQGRVAVVLDDEWRSKMRVRDRIIVSLMTWPLLVAYGYVGGRGHGSPRKERHVTKRMS